VLGKNYNRPLSGILSNATHRNQWGVEYLGITTFGGGVFLLTEIREAIHKAVPKRRAIMSARIPRLAFSNSK
jgi:hypothetical protein